MIFNPAGTYRWLEKTGTSLGELSLQFNTNKFDSFINGTILLTSDSITSNSQINYKFDNAKNEHLKLYFKLKDLSNKLKTAMLTNVEVQSSAYPEMNWELHLNFQVSRIYIHI